jgi:hypothetical protein
VQDLYRIYIDDSGNVDPATTNAPEVRFGSITGVVLKASYLDETFNNSFPELVKKHFGTKEDGTPHNLHRRVLAAPPDHGPFSVLKDEAKRKAWDADSLSMFDRADYTVISASVDKVSWYYDYPTWQGDFYEVLVQAVLERCFYFLRNRNGKAEVNIETKGKRDQRINERYRDALQNGFEFISPEKLQSVFTSKEMNILKKDDAKPGCQMADLLAGPSMRMTRYKNKDEPIEGEYVKKVCDILEDKKFYRETRGGKIHGPDGYGRIWRPKLK